MTPEYHDAANIFPLDDTTLQELSEDIKANGLLCPIELFEGKIIDGRRRFIACRQADVAPVFCDVTPDDPFSYVVSLNLNRRHLTLQQRAIVAARIRKHYDREAKERQRASGGDHDKKALPVNLPEPGDARDAAGKAMGVSGKSVDYATKLINQGTDELISACERGEVAISTAAKMSSLPAAEQKTWVAGAKGRRTRESPPVEPDKSQRPSKGIEYANKAIDCLKKIRRNDPFRARAFEIVKDWMRHNK